MKQRMFALLMTLCLLVGLLPAAGVPASAAGIEKFTFEQDGLIYEAWQYGSDRAGKLTNLDSVAVKSVADGVTDVTIPATIDYTYVDEEYDNGDGTFGYTKECKDVKVLFIHNNIFAGSSLRRLDLSALTGCDFYDEQLTGCASLEELILPADMSSIPTKFCADCTSLRSIDLPDTITALGARAFQNTGLTHIDLPDGLREIGAYCFADTQITELTVPASVTTLRTLEHPNMANPIKTITLERTDLSKMTFGLIPKDVTVYIQPGVAVPDSLKEALVLTLGEEAPNFELSIDKTDLDFGTVEPFGVDRETKTVTITNTGNAAVEDLYFDWKDDFGKFSFSFPQNNGNMTKTLAPGESFRIDLSPRPQLDPGEYVWNMRIACNRDAEACATLKVKVTEGPGCLFFPDGKNTLDFGTKNVGETGTGNKFVTIYNGAGQDVRLTIPQSQYYDIQFSGNPVIKAGSSASFGIKPKMGTSTAGDYSEVLHFDPGNDKADLKVSYTVNGGSLSVSPSTLTFDDLQTGYTTVTPRTVTIKNTGAGSMTLSKYEVSGNGFEVASYPSPLTLAPGASATMSVRPKTGLEPDDYSGTLNLEGTGGVTASVRLRLTVTGTSALSASPGALRFASAQENGTWPDAQTVTVTNSGTETLTLKAPTAKNYTVGSLSRSSLSAGQSATFTVQPKANLSEGSYRETLTIATDKDAKATVSVSFEVVPAGKPVFTDVPSGIYYEDAVVWAAENNITSGTSATTFSPDMVCTRAQMVTFLWKAAGSPKAKNTATSFTDVPAGAYYADAVAWAVEQKITSGTSDATFSPDVICSRGQTVTFLWRSQGSPKAGGANPFTDVPAGAYYTDAVLWAVEKKITSGTSDTTFAPDHDCTRGQIVTFLYRCMGK